MYEFLWTFIYVITWLQAASGRHVIDRFYDDTGRISRIYSDERRHHIKQPEITAKDLPKNGELFEGDMIMDNHIRRSVLGIKNEKRSGVISSEVGEVMHWPDGIVPYTFNDNLNHAVRKQIEKGIKLLRKRTCVKFIPRTTQEDFVEFQDGKGCSSSVGRQGGKQTIHLAYGCKRIGTVIHEMMHTIGIIHEQSRPDRDDHLIVRFKHIKKDLLPNFRKYSIREADSMGIPYNFFSVMHYSNYAFSKDQQETLISKNDPHLKFGQRMELTPLDVKQINKLYPCKKRITARDARHLIPNMTERDIEERKRDAIMREEWVEDANERDFYKKK